MVLDAATADNAQTLLPFLDNLINGIHAHVCQLIHYPLLVLFVNFI